ncbi:hypothetical protein STEG23_012100 [Scotinomys teguina]
MKRRLRELRARGPDTRRPRRDRDAGRSSSPQTQRAGLAPPHLRPGARSAVWQLVRYLPRETPRTRRPLPGDPGRQAASSRTSRYAEPHNAQLRCKVGSYSLLVRRRYSQRRRNHRD